MDFSNKVPAVFVIKKKYIYIFWNFSMKTAQHLEGILRENSVNFGENFRKIHQTANISTQQRCHAAGIFVTLPHSPNLPYSEGIGSPAAAIRFLKVV